MNKMIKIPAEMPAVAGLRLKYFIGKGERAKSFFRRTCAPAVWLGLMFVGVNVALLGVQTAHAVTNSISVDFNATGELAGLFNDGYATPAWSQNTTGGISGGGGITIPNGSSDLYICKQGFPLQVGATYTVGAYYYNQYDNGYGGLGFTTLTSGIINGGHATPLSAIGVSFHGGGGIMDNNNATTSSTTNVIWDTSLETAASGWFYFKETLNVTGANTFSQTFEIWQCDTNGNPGTKFTTTTITGQVNATLGAAATLYPFFGASVSRFIAADSFTATTSVTGTAATVTLDNLSQTYDGTAKAVTATTTPDGLTVNLTYNGNANAPTNAGSFTVIGTISDPTYYGSATNTLVINRATPGVTAWPTAIAIAYGQTLAASTLRGGSASVDGSFGFTTPSTAPGIGTASQGVTFTPTDITDYNTVNGSVSVTVFLPPTITAQPANQVVAVGGTVNLSVAATNDGPLYYQWFKNGGMVLRATNSTLTLTSADVADSGGYYVVVANASSLSISLPVTVTVGTPQLLAWGYNGFGQLGDGTTTDKHLPESVTSNVVAVSAGADHSLFVKADGTLWAMGNNAYGQLGDGTTTDKHLPESVASNVVAVAAGTEYSLYLTSDGTLWAMGQNYFGQLGDGTTTDKHLPESVASNVVAMAAGMVHSLFVTSHGTLWAMGRNNYGQLGDGTMTSRSNAVSVANNVVAVAAGMVHSLFVKSDGTLWGMGANVLGQLGDGTGIQPINPESIASNVVAMAAGEWHTLFLTSDGTLWAMGWNSYGQLGDGSNFFAAFVPKSVASNVVAVAAGELHSLFLKSDGALWAMGDDQYGQLGDGTTNTEYFPESVPVMPLANVISGNTGAHTLAVGAPAAVTVTVAANPPNAGSVTGGGVYDVGDSNVTLTATASNNWQFIGWNDGTTNNSYVITVPDTNITYTANFAATATITAGANTNVGGSVIGGGTFLVGSTNLITAVASNNWVFVEWSDGTTNNFYTIVVASNLTVMAEFAPAATVATVALPPEGGSTAGDGTYAIGSSATLTATASNNWQFIGWNDGAANNPYVITVPDTNVTYTANFAVTMANAPWENGFCYTVVNNEGTLQAKIIGYDGPTSGTIRIPAVIAGLPVAVIGTGAFWGKKFDKVVVPDSVKTIEVASIDAVVVVFMAATVSALPSMAIGAFASVASVELGAMATGAALALIAADLSLYFQSMVAVIVTADPFYSANCSGSGLYKRGSYVEISATADEGWEFTKWDDGSTDTQREIEAGVDGIYFTAKFEEEEKEVEVEAEAEPAWGGSVSGGGTYLEGDPVILHATPNGSWRFNGWFLDGLVTNSPTLIMVASSSLEGLKYKAHFEQTILVTGLANPTNAGSVAGGGVYDLDDTNKTLTATVSNNWVFVNWNDGATNNPYTIPPITVTNLLSITYTANFAASNPANITTSVSGNTLTLAWPADHLGWILQALTNDLNSASWFDLPGTGDTNSVAIPINPANPAVFYRLRRP